MPADFLQLAERLFAEKLARPKFEIRRKPSRAPVHVVYGGAHLFKSETPRKLGALALRSIESYAPNFVEFARAMWLKGADSLPVYEEPIQDLEFRLADDPARVRAERPEAYFAWTVYNRVVEKLKREPVEDFRIDFEDGYGLRRDEEEDAHALAASDELARAFREHLLPAFCGFRVKSLQAETRRRSARTLDLFLTNLLQQTGGRLPDNFVVTLPKITSAAEVAVFDELLTNFEKARNLPEKAIPLEIMIETPEAVRELRALVEAAADRVTAAHFGAYDYTASFGIAGPHQHLRHDACRFARQMMQIELAPLGLRLSDSVTTEMPAPVHRGDNLMERERAENASVVRAAWRKHFHNVTCSLIDGFYQSWDLHPAQLAARYAAVYAFFLESADEQAARLKGFIGKATQAMLTGNQFDDAASAQGLLNFFARALACGAITTEEAEEKTGLSAAEIVSGSFAEMMKKIEN